MDRQKQKKIFVIAGAGLVLLLLIIIGVSQKKRLPFLGNSVPTPPTAGAKIYFAPGLVTLKNATGKQSVDLVVDSGGNRVGQVTIRMSYDPNTLTNVHVTTADFSKANYTIRYQFSAGAIDRVRGQIYIAFSVVPYKRDPSAITPKAVKVASVTFEVKNAPENPKTLFSFLPTTAVYGPQVPVVLSVNGKQTVSPNVPKPTSLLQLVQPLQATQ